MDILKIVKQLHERLGKHRATLLTLCAVVVFCITYILILPAFTLDADEAKGQGGIDAPATVRTEDSAENGTDTEDNDLDSRGNISDGIPDESEEKEADTDSNRQSATDRKEDLGGTDSGHEENRDEIRSLTAEGSDYSIKLLYGSEAGIPDGATLEAREIETGTKEYDRYLQHAQETLDTDNQDTDIETNIRFARFFDITILDDEKEIEPSAPATVIIEYDDPPEVSDEETADIIHFADSGTELIKTVDEERKDEIGETDSEFVFEQSSFSVTGTLITQYQLAAGTYCIVVNTGGKWYALSNYGSTVEVDYDSSTGTINYIGNANLRWKVTNRYSALGLYYIQGADYSGNYLQLTNNTVCGPQKLIHISGPYDDNKHFQLSTDYPGSQYYNGYDTKQSLGWTNSSFVSKADPVNVYLVKQTTQYTFTVQASSGGYVAGTNSSGQSINNASSYTDVTWNNIDYNLKSSNMHVIEAVNADGYSFDHWELDGVNVSSNKKINSGEITFSRNGSVLKAVFKKDTTSTDNKPGRSVDKDRLDNWYKELLERTEPIDANGYHKTAEVYDYANRIYRVDMDAESHFSTFDGTIDLGFILDVSASMKFPSKLVESSDVTSKVKITDLNNYNGNPGLKTNKTYYIITDASDTSTVYRIWYEGGQWYSIDASIYPGDSNYSSKKALVGKQTYTESDSNVTTYRIYESADNDSSGNPVRRSYYEQQSMNQTQDALKNILKQIAWASDSSNNPDVKVAGITYDKQIQSQDYTFESAQTGWMDISYSYSGGTSTDYALNAAAGNYIATDENGESTNMNRNPGFKWDSNSKRYCILITDGAPQRKIKKNGITNQATDALVKETAKRLKDKDVTLICVGLSMDDVEKGSSLLNSIASTSTKDGQPYFYRAESGDDLQYVLYEIIQQIMYDAIVQGDITDTIDKAFYPVDKLTGQPLQAGDRINLNGEKTTDTNQPYGVISYSNGKYTVTWADQDIPWEKWHGSVFVKAKEDFLGGNTINTNDGDATIKVKSYKVTPGAQKIEFKQDKQITYAMTTPYVNVNELNINENSTEWTVYLGTTVDPLAELKELMGKVVVEEVVSKTTDDHTLPQSGGEMLYPLLQSADEGREQADGAEPETFTLSTITGNLTDDDWAKLIKGQELNIDYSAYGHDAGKITIKLTSRVESGEDGLDESPHAAKVTGTGVEQYTLSITYTPADLQDKDYKTGSYGLGVPGDSTDTLYSSNNHLINVFAKGLEITKMDQSFTNKLTGAKFVLYRTARDSDLACDKVTLPETEGQYVAVATLDMSSSSTASIDNIARLGAGEKYYLVETKAPAGYNMLTAPIPVTLNINDTYTIVPAGTSSENKPTGEPYNWIETATLTIGDNSTSGKVQMTDNQGNALQAGTAIPANSTSDKVYYDIANDAGIELPSTGGPGTTLFYVIGAILILTAATLAIRRRRIY